MSEKYNMIMNDISVTDEMHERIMANVRAAGTASNVVRFPMRRVVSIAACIVVLIAGILIATRILSNPAAPSASPSSDQTVDMAGSGITEYSSSAELSKAVGFTMCETSSLPFDVTDRSYVAYPGKLGEVTYSGSGDQTASLRKGPGTNDISGDYSEYTSVKQVTAGAYTVTLKGDKGGYSLAIWTDGTYSYSLSIDPETSERSFVAAVTSIK